MIGISDLARELGVSRARLYEIMVAAGIASGDRSERGANNRRTLTEEEQQKLLAHLSERANMKRRGPKATLTAEKLSAALKKAAREERLGGWKKMISCARLLHTLHHEHGWSLHKISRAAGISAPTVQRLIKWAEERKRENEREKNTTRAVSSAKKER